MKGQSIQSFASYVPRFHLDMFNHNTTKKENYLDKHKKIIKEKQDELLTHPIMMFFMSLKWHHYQKWYSVNFLIFLAFLVSLTIHAAYYVKFIHCECFRKFNDTEKCTVIVQKGDYEDEMGCKSNFQQTLMITSCTTWIFLCILTCYEILQFLSKLVAAIKGDGYSKFHEYYSQQNICEIIMLGLCQSFFIIRSMAPELKNEESELLMHLLGWSLFMAWLDLTIFLARFNIF